MEQRIDPQHSGPRSTLRVLGPAMIVLGAVLLVFGAIRMFGFDRGPREDPAQGFMTGQRSIDEVGRRMDDDFDSRAKSSFGGFAMIAAGMVCLAVGLAMTGYGYMGRVARYVAEETAPVAKDTFNYMAEGAKSGVQSVAQSVAAGIAQGVRGQGLPPVVSPPLSPGPQCPNCGAALESDAGFCSRCGLARDKACPGCGQHNKFDARFCRQCGKALA